MGHRNTLLDDGWNSIKTERSHHNDWLQAILPYDIDLEFYRDARSQFSIHEWIDVIIEAIDYNPTGT